MLKEVTWPEVRSLAERAESEGAFLAEQSSASGLVTTLTDLSGKPGTHFFIVSDDGNARIGFIAVLPTSRPATVFIGPMYIAPEFRRSGQGRRMVEAFVAWARGTGKFRRVHVTTWGTNAGSRAIFEKLGFRLVLETPGARVNGDSTAHYSLPLI